MTPLEETADFADVPLDVEVELDRRLLAIRDLLDLDVGTVIAMKRSAGENFDVLIGGSLIGTGEVVIIEDAMAIRVTGFRTED